MGVGGRVGEISGKYSRNFREISGKIPGIRKREIDVVKRQNEILMYGLRENNSTMIPDTPVEYLRNSNLDAFRRLFPTPFISYHQFSSYSTLIS